MSLRDRIKLIFKKYSFTTVAILISVGMVIGGINSLRDGLSTLGKGLGNGLKTIIKKNCRYFTGNCWSYCFFFVS